MATATTEAATSSIAEPKASAGKKGQGSRRRRGARVAEPSTARFFLIKTSGNGTVELGQEVASENEAMVESFRVGGSFAVVTEWRAASRSRDGCTRHQEGGSQIREESSAFITGSTALCT